MTPRLRPTKRSCDKLVRHWQCVVVAVYPPHCDPCMQSSTFMTQVGAYLNLKEGGLSQIISQAEARFVEVRASLIHSGGWSACLTCVRGLRSDHTDVCRETTWMWTQRFTWGTLGLVWRRIIVFKEQICIWECGASQKMERSAWHQFRCTICVFFYVPTAQIFRPIICFVVEWKKKMCCL